MTAQLSSSDYQSRRDYSGPAYSLPAPSSSQYLPSPPHTSILLLITLQSLLSIDFSLCRAKSGSDQQSLPLGSVRAELSSSWWRKEFPACCCILMTGHELIMDFTAFDLHYGNNQQHCRQHHTSYLTQILLLHQYFDTLSKTCGD